MGWAGREHPGRREVVRAELPRVKVSKIKMVGETRKSLKASGTKPWLFFMAMQMMLLESLSH